MCGICGIIGNNNYHQYLSTMLKRIQHRGPDGEGTWVKENVSFGHRRLSIIDLSENAKQPMVDNETGNVITYNGEIYNYVELRNDLSSYYSFKSQSDTEVILASYRKYGTKCFKYFRGMFALAIYDPKRKVIILARDRFGIKPLYYRSGQEYFLFSSEIKGLINFGNLPDSANAKSICRFLAARQTDVNDETFYNEVKQILPGSFLTIDEQGKIVEQKKYWYLKLPGEKPIEKNDLDELTELLEDTIKIHLRADVPVGAFLSGGIDSSTIVCYMEKFLGNNKFHTFSSLLEIQNEENKLIGVIQKKINSFNHDLLLNGDSFLSDLTKLLYYQDEPFADASMYAHYMLVKEASKLNLKVLLSGNGGDEVFGGYYAHIYSNIGYLIKYLKLIRLFKALKNYKKFNQLEVTHIILKGLQQALPTNIKRKYKHSVYQKYFNHLNKDFYFKNDIDYYYFEHIDPRIENYVNMIENWTLPQFLHYEDRNGMAFGIELRVPFIDHILIEKVNEFDPSVLVDGRTKSLLRQLIIQIVPAEVVNQRGKFAFAAPLDIFIKRNQNQIIEQYLELLKNQSIFDEKLSIQLLNNFRKSENDENLLIFWRTYITLLWYDIFFNNKSYLND
uniref:asparagine synthase (glutamine-hydrolyzing) n=1 Tax=Ignavibacterium album TaxID=591197 RepID=A0A7V2ZK10_9BACT